MPGQARTCKNLYKMSQVPDCKPCYTYILANLTLGPIKADKVFFSYNFKYYPLRHFPFYRSLLSTEQGKSGACADCLT